MTCPASLFPGQVPAFIFFPFLSFPAIFGLRGRQLKAFLQTPIPLFVEAIHESPLRKRELAHEFIQGSLAGLRAEIIAQQDSLAKIANFRWAKRSITNSLLTDS